MPATPAPTKAPAKAKAPTRAASKKKQPAATATSQSIEEQTKAFLKSGGEIEQIGSGVSGQQSMAGPKHITLGNSNNNKPVENKPAENEAVENKPEENEAVENKTTEE